MEKHGGYQLALSERVLIAQITGSWNEEAAREFDAQFRQRVASFNGETWGHLVLLDDWELGTPDIEPIVTELTAWCISQRLTHAAQIFSDSQIKKFQLDKMITEKIDGFERRQFRDINEGLQWLHASGYVCSLPDFLKQ